MTEEEKKTVELTKEEEEEKKVEKTQKERDEEEEDEDPLYDLSNPDVVDKYTTCGEITNMALKFVIAQIKDGADVHEICKSGDEFILTETGKKYNKRAKLDENDKKNMKKKDIEEAEEKNEGRVIKKGVAFPTCLSINEVAAHFSPMKQDTKALKAGDVVKVDLGVHIDGFITQGAHTVLVTGEGVDKVTDRRADVVKATWTAAEAALRKLEVGSTNNEVTAVMALAADEFKVKGVCGVLGHQLKRNKIDGNRTIINRENPEHGLYEKVNTHKFKANEVYCVDVMMSTGEGKCKELTDFRHTVYKRTEENYMLKTPKARQFMSEVNNKFPHMPFTLRSIEDEGAARIGIKEAIRHEILNEFPVLQEKKEIIAQFKFTVLLLANGTKKVTGLPFEQEALFESEKTVENEELKTLLAKTVGKKKRKPKAKKEDKTE